jgi:subtilisin family serine protease
MKHTLLSTTHLGLLTIAFLTTPTSIVRAVYHRNNDFDTKHTEPNVFQKALQRRWSLEDISKIAGLINATEKELNQPKLGSALNKLLDSKVSSGGENDKILLDIVFTSPMDNVVAKTMFASIVGVYVINCFGATCSVYATIGNLKEIAKVDTVKFLRPPKFITSTGKVTSQGVKAMYADVASAKYSVNGTGILIGVMSDSYNCLGGAARDVSSGDLPRGSTILSDYTADECISEYGTDEGRAMMQLIHDVAPGARLAFRTAGRGEADVAVGIVELANIGCDIIVDDVLYGTEPFFQDGIIAQAVDQVVAQGVAFFSAAFNNGRNAWEEPNGFRPVDIDGVVMHQFGTDGSGEPILLQRVAMQNSGELFFVLQWDEPFYSVSGASGSACDIDIYLFFNGTIVASGIDDNILSGDPLEFFGFDPAEFSSDDIVYIDMAIVKKAGPPPKYMKIVIVLGEVTFEFDNGSATSYGHSNAASAAGVGAAYYLKTPAFGVSPPLIEPYSSVGGIPKFFDVAGNRFLSPEIRQQPRFTGPDGGMTTFFGDRRNRFFGTSASAPHVAAVAALLLDIKGGPKSLSPLEIYSIMEQTAIDMDDPFTPAFDTGFDFATGHGLVNAVAALDKLCTITWKLYNSRTDKLVAPLRNNAVITRPPPCGRTNIEALVPCGASNNRVLIELFQGNRRIQRNIESTVPYFLFSNSGSDVLDGKIRAGRYSIRVTVDGIVSPFTNFTLGGTCS